MSTSLLTLCFFCSSQILMFSQDSMQVSTTVLPKRIYVTQPLGSAEMPTSEGLPDDPVWGLVEWETILLNNAPMKTRHQIK
ncbi:MAG: hypothetical protein MUO53_03935 [Maribacter sp.]|nr:hypothetical protein [Maribacter sp.]